MWNQLLPILLGFLLTTMVGGMFASRLQQRSWRHQNEAQLQEAERNKASEVCTNLARLIDKRCYRMKRLHGAIVGHAQGRVPRDTLDTRLADYDQILFEWNDQLNANLAVVGAYFGRDLRDHLDHQVYSAFRHAGQHLETLYHQAADVDTQGLDNDRAQDVAERIRVLTDSAYRLIVVMAVRVRTGQVGQAAPHPLNENVLQLPQTTSTPRPKQH